MTITRTLTVLSLSVAAFLSSAQTAKADTLQDIFRTIRQVQVNVGGQRTPTPSFKPGFQPGFQPGPVAPPRFGTVCPPPPPQHCVVYCVYYLDCHGHWKLYGEFRSQWQANSAKYRLRNQGYRTYTRVKRIQVGFPGGGFPGVPTGPVLFNR